MNFSRLYLPVPGKSFRQPGAGTPQDLFSLFIDYFIEIKGFF
jgi:hypothetical protein